MTCTRSLIVGCSGGIGTAIAERLESEGRKLVGLDIVPSPRRADPIKRRLTE